MDNVALESTQQDARKGDGVLRISQDNAARALIIEEINDAALARLGYAEDEVKGRKFEVLLGHASALVIDEELEYDDAAPDMADIFVRYRELRLRLRSGQEIGVAYRLHRLLASDHRAQFQLILPNDREDRMRQNLRDFLKNSLEGHQQLDPVTGFPNRTTMEAMIARMQHFSAETQAEMCVATIRLDRFENAVKHYGFEPAQALVKHVLNCCRATFRTEDVVASLGNHIGVLMINLSRESARVVLNRLRWNIGKRMIEFGGKSNFSVTVSLTFDMLTSDNAAQILQRCEQAVTELDANARNAFLELGN